MAATEPKAWWIWGDGWGDIRVSRQSADEVAMSISGTTIRPLYPGPPVKPGQPHVPCVVVTVKRLEALEGVASGVRQFLHPDNLIDADGLAERLAALESKGKDDGETD